MLNTILGGRYQIISHLGGGGFGQTYLAEDRQLPGNHRCVVKQLKPVTSDPKTLQTARRLFDTEAQVLYNLGTHPQIPQLLAYFEENQEFYLVQEYIEGWNLSQEITRPQGCYSEDEVIALLKEILEILEFVHKQNVIHRDINPRNILRRQKDGKLVLIDFGAVKQITAQTINPQGYTNLSVIVGTPGYMPSEQARGNPKLSSDIYAVGMIAIQALTGLLPSQLPIDHNTEEILWHELVTVSQDLTKIIDKMVRYDFRDRFHSATEALQAIEELTKPNAVTMPVLIPASPPQKKYTKKILIGLISFAFLGASTVASMALVKAINYNNATEQFNRGKTLASLKRYQQAIGAYQRAIELKPDYVEAWKNKGDVLYNMKKYQEALDAYDKAIQIKPDYVEAWNGRGIVLKESQQYEEAIASFEEALKIDSSNVLAWKEKGDALMGLPKYEAAITAYERALEYQPDYWEAWYNRGWALHNLQRYEEAIKSYEKALEFNTDFPQAWYNRGNSLLKINRQQEAIESYEQALRLKPDYFKAWYSRGAALSQMRKYEQAIESYEKAINLQPENGEAWKNLGGILHQMRRYEEAIRAYDRAIQVQQNDAQAWYNKGNAQYSLKRYEQALASYDSAVYLKPDYFEAWYSRGNALLSLKRYEQAIASYEKAIQYKPDFREALEAQKQAQKQLEAIQIKPESAEKTD